jgi:hypothetical protein
MLVSLNTFQMQMMIFLIDKELKSTEKFISANKHKLDFNKLRPEFNKKLKELEELRKELHTRSYAKGRGYHYAENSKTDGD